MTSPIQRNEKTRFTVKKTTLLFGFQLARLAVNLPYKKRPLVNPTCSARPSNRLVASSACFMQFNWCLVDGGARVVVGKKQIQKHKEKKRLPNPAGCDLVN